MEQVELSREVEAVAIPAGNTIRLEKGAVAFVSQALGGSYTLQVPEIGGLVRIAGKDADAIGKEPTIAEGQHIEGTPDLEQQIWTTLKTCYDPEIPVNIVDLGLIYDMNVTSLPDGGNRVDVKMTLTAPGCGMGTVIAAEAQQKIAEIGGISEASVDIVWDPPWNPEMISEDGKERLGMV